MPNFKKGDTKVLLITHGGFKRSQGIESPPLEIKFEAYVTVLDKTDSGFTMQWVFHLPAAFKKAHPELENNAPVYEGLKMIFHTSPTGVFKDLVNWKEVRDAYIKQQMLAMPQPLDEKSKAKLAGAVALFNTRETVEGGMLQEVQLYHMPYGQRFSTRGSTAHTYITIPYVKTPLRAVETRQITSLDSYSHTFTLAFTQDINKGSMKVLMQDVLKATPGSKDSVDKILSALPPEFDWKAEKQFRIPTEAGWVAQVKYTRTAVIGQVTNIENLSIVLKPDEH